MHAPLKAVLAFLTCCCNKAVFEYVSYISSVHPVGRIHCSGKDLPGGLMSPEETLWSAHAAIHPHHTQTIFQGKA